MNIPLNAVTLRRAAAILISVYGGLTAASVAPSLPTAVSAVLISIYPAMVLLEHALGISATPAPTPTPAKLTPPTLPPS